MGLVDAVSAGEKKTRTRWPGMRDWRRRDNNTYRTLVRKLLRRGTYEQIDPPRRTSAKWSVW